LLFDLEYTPDKKRDIRNALEKSFFAFNRNFVLNFNLHIF